jgi:Fe-S cluster biogenesis protein NfuA/nitrite reductase/ring-hydroxylating ferredoxin subunit
MREDAEELAVHVQELTERVAEIPDPAARGLAEELASALMALYGEGLTRIVETLDEAGEPGARLRAQLQDDGVVASLMLIHDLYPVDLETRVLEALDSIRPYMESHGGDVELLSLQDGIARLRLEGHCHGCAASASTLELAIKQALEETAPDLLGLEVEGVVEPPATSMGIPLPMAGVGSAPGWSELEGDVAPGTAVARSAGGRELLVANVAGTLLAYANACAACGARLDGGALDGAVLSCPGCGTRFDLHQAGEGADGAGLQLEPVPLLPQDGRVVVAA